MRSLLMLLLAACGPDVSVSKVAVDADSDGYDSEVDCDDARADVNPTADEVCDGRDNDCDTAVDEQAVDAVTFYPDGDGDGFGDPNAPSLACDAPEDATEDNTDCDEADSAVFPGADEVCNGKDDDCDGESDEDAVDATTTYADTDGDGYGDANTASVGCEHGSDRVSDGTDCDDDDPAVHPDALEPDCTDPVDYNCDGAVGYADLDADGWAACEDCDDTDASRNPGNAEVCDGVLDEDCDGLVDDDDPDVTDPSTWYRDADADGWGDPAVTTAACVEPSGFVVTDGDCDDADPARSPSLTEVCDNANLDEDCSGAADDDDAGTDASTFITYAPDDDGDGYGDPDRTLSMCDAPAGYGTDATDCDDTNAGVNPAAQEVCNRGDDDCDTLVDDADGDVTDTADWYADADADAYGGTTMITACFAPLGYISTANDCDDGDDSVYPGADDVCDDTIDQDCSGTDEVCPADPAAEGFVRIEATTFTMGSTDGMGVEMEGAPAHTVTLTRAFWVGITEVTQAEFSAALGYEPSNATTCGDDCPVEGVSWHEAAAYTNALSSAEGLAQCYACTGTGASVTCTAPADPYACEGYRLAMEAEWEAAARCGTDLRYAGSDDIALVAVVGSTTGAIQPTASLSPNGCGLYDMSGNIWEWTNDAYELLDADAVTDPIGDPSGSGRVGRGGSWGDIDASATVAFRAFDYASTRYDFVGLRVFRTAP